MKIKQLNEKNINELNNSLITLYKKKLKLLIEKSSTTEFKNNHLLKNIKKDIARTLTIINIKKRENA